MTVSFDFGGFLAPVDQNAVNLIKTGATIPIKWRIPDQNLPDHREVVAVIAVQDLVLHALHHHERAPGDVVVDHRLLSGLPSPA